MFSFPWEVSSYRDFTTSTVKGQRAIGCPGCKKLHLICQYSMVSRVKIVIDIFRKLKIVFQYSDELFQITKGIFYSQKIHKSSLDINVS